jgi:elongation factor Ts
MQITAAMVKELRERTGAGMMECKKALVEAEGNLETAIENMRKSGLAKADKKAGRVAAEGLIAFAITADNTQAAMVEVNCETDFVTKGDDFKAFAQAIADRVLASDPADMDALNAMPLNEGGETVEDTRKALIAKIGENMNVRRFVRYTAEAGNVLASYLHGTRIGVLVELKGGDATLGRDLAMHVAASRPVCVSADDVPAEMLEKERAIVVAQAEESGKPANIVEKMVEGRMRKFINEITLLGQPFVKDPDQSVEQLLKSAGAEVVRFDRLEVGEGIEKKQENFAEEVMAQAKGA